MEFLRKITALLLIGGSCFLNLNAQNTDWATKQRNIQNFALTLSSGEDSLSYSYFSLGVTGHYNQLKGLGINLLANHSNRDMTGMMLSGMVNIAGRNSQGMAIAGIANVSGKQMNGMNIGGLMNVSGSCMNGMQISGIGNISGTSFNGVTAGGLINLSGTNSNGIILSGIANITGQDLNGIALSGLMNVAGKDANGVQISGLSNITAGKLQGLQAAALLNIATQNNGLQIGAVNVAEKIKGLQIGLVNYSRDTTGHKIGLVNLTPATRYQLMVYGGNCSKFNVAARFKNRYTYTILGAGTNYLDFDKKFSADVFYRAGLWLPLAKRWEISADGGYVHIETFKNNHLEIPERMYALQARLNLEFRGGDNWGLFASGGYSWTRYYDANRSFEKKPLVELGIVLF